MDALTSSSADREPGSNSAYANRRSGEANAASTASRPENQGDWDWFTPAKPHATDDPDDNGPATGGFSDPVRRETDPHQRSADGGDAGIPSRAPTAIRPVGSGTQRTGFGDQAPQPEAPWPTSPDVPPSAQTTRAGLPTRPLKSPGSAAEAAAATRGSRPEPPTQAEGSWFDPASDRSTEHQRPAPPNPRTQAQRPAAQAQPPQAATSWGSTPPVPGVHTPRAPGATAAEAPATPGQFTAPQRPTAPREQDQRDQGRPSAPQPAPMTRPFTAPERQPATGERPSAASRPPAAEPPVARAPRDEPMRTRAAAPPTADGNAALPADAVLIRRTMDVIEPVADKTTSYFYALLFTRHPELRDLFPAAMDVQRDRLFKALLTAVRHVDDPDTLTEYLSHLGRGHRKYGTRPEHYPAVGECLLGALTRYACDVWNEEVEAAWVRAYTTISQIMIDAAAAAELTSPPWWQAEVVSHERRTKDIAVVTVRPDQPYPFLAGQYTSVETPWWPRVWRHYSFASAPRPDGLLSFHIKAVPAGWVSSALVNRARPGDVIRLGPPAGSMIVDHGTDNGLLCLGGGTGIAPIKALVEDVAEHGRRRAVEVFYGARHDHDLYDLDTMLRLEQEHPWLSVRPVVSEGASGGLTGPLSEVVSRCGPWHSFDAYLSGPAGMIRSSVDALVGLGMPSHRIRHDSLAELIGAAGH